MCPAAESRSRANVPHFQNGAEEGRKLLLRGQQLRFIADASTFSRWAVSVFETQTIVMDSIIRLRDDAHGLTNSRDYGLEGQPKMNPLLDFYRMRKV